MTEHPKETEVSLQIVSRVETGGEGETERKRYRAQLVQKGAVLYLRYSEELAEGGYVTTALKLEEDQLTIIRHGALRMRHTYRLGEKTTSIYQTPHGALSMETETTELAISPLQAVTVQGQCTLAYRLMLQEQFVGQFRLEFHFS